MTPTELLQTHIWPTPEMGNLATKAIALLRLDLGADVTASITLTVPDNRTLGEFARALSVPTFPPNEMIPAYCLHARQGAILLSVEGPKMVQSVKWTEQP